MQVLVVLSFLNFLIFRVHFKSPTELRDILINQRRKVNEFADWTGRVSRSRATGKPKQQQQKQRTENMQQMMLSSSSASSSPAPTPHPPASSPAPLLHVAAPLPHPPHHGMTNYHQHPQQHQQHHQQQPHANTVYSGNASTFYQQNQNTQQQYAAPGFHPTFPQTLPDYSQPQYHANLASDTFGKSVGVGSITAVSDVINGEGGMPLL
jgi:hypothetical protein